MLRIRKSGGFSLVEMLLVLAIFGILAGIAVPTFLSQRKRSRVIGDAKANAGVLRLQLESHRADTGVYGSTGVTYTWTNTAAPSASVNPAPYFTTGKGNTVMNYRLTISSTGLGYTLNVNDTTIGSALVYQTNQNGSNLYTIH